MDKNIVKLFLRYHLSLYLCVLFASQICFAQSSALEKVLLLPTVNQKTLPEALLFLKDMQGNYLISQQNWQALGLKLPTNLPLSIDGGSYYRLNDLADIQFEVNPKKSIINLMVDARFFSKSTLKYPNSQWIANNNNSKGAYLNYDISLLNQNDTFFQNAFTETVFFNQQFSFEHTVLFKRDDIVNKQTRLNTVASYSLPTKKTTIKIGDYISSTIALGENVRLLGVKFGTDFSLQPDKVYSPQISLSGAAVIPSTVDIFVNNVKKFSQNVPSGEFSIQDIPVVSGQGTAKMVITDIMGRKQEVIQPYYSSPVLLGKGLVDYSYQFGALRQNYGIDSENYDELLTNFSLKYGLSNQLTLDLNSQLLTEQQALTVGAAAAIANWVVVRGLVSASHQSELNEGYAYGLSLEHRNNFLGAGFDTKYYSPKYVHLSNNTVTQPKSASQVFVNQQISQRGSLTANYMQQQYYGQDSVKIAQFGYGLGLKNYGNVNLSAIFSQFGHKKNQIYQLSYSVPLFAGNSERNHNLSVLLSDNKKSLNLQNRPIAATGLGYVFRAEHDKIDKFDLDVKFKHSSRDYGLKVSQANHYTSTELSAAGSVTWINDTLLTGQRIDQAFAFVTIPNFNHVGVYHDNRLIGYTNQQGHLIVPRLRPYQKNTLRIKLQDLPFDTTISKTQQIVAPNYRHGVIVKFDAKKSFGAKMTIKQHNGEFVPVGAVIYQPQSQASFVVGLNGLAYITDISPQPQPFMVLWPNNRCQVLVGGKPNNQYLTDLGELVCESVKP